MAKNANSGLILRQILAENLRNFRKSRDRHQLLEIKLQTSPTIDLGLVSPDDTASLNIPPILDDINIRYCDVRYALFYGVTNGVEVTLTNFFLTTGENFFSRFPQFQGKVVNKKIQIPLPPDFFD